VCAVYSRLEPASAPSHNDLFKPDNMLFDGNHLWLVDWEAAFQNDRYADLAAVANMIVTNDSEENAYLREYFGQPPNEYQRARFYLARQLAHMFYAMAFLTIGPPEKSSDGREPVPTYSDYQRRFWAREVSLTDNHAKAIYGRVHWERLAENMRQTRFEEALKTVADKSASAG
jgi:thiamine kinase-like enzyme